ncbi:MAG: hypothetical protein PHU25_00940 [Deltaproteobacteria bacterium]|nr:hypothetical protein [Deltaproteobacteria bacterium]
MTKAGGNEGGRGMERVSDEQHEKDEQVFSSFIETASRPRRARVTKPQIPGSRALTPGLSPDYDTDDQVPELIEE